MSKLFLGLGLLLAFSAVSADELERVVFECRVDSYGASNKIVLVATMFPGESIGWIDVADTRHLTTYRVTGVNRRWDWGDGGESYAFVIKPDGEGLYYDFSFIEDGGTTTPSQLFICKKNHKAAASNSKQSAQLSSSGTWAVQLGRFRSKEDAERLAAELRQQGYAAFLSQSMTSNGLRHRVRVGPQSDRAEAEAVAASLNKAGHDGKVMPHP